MSYNLDDLEMQKTKWLLSHGNLRTWKMSCPEQSEESCFIFIWSTENLFKLNDLLCSLLHFPNPEQSTNFLFSFYFSQADNNVIDGTVYDTEYQLYGYLFLSISCRTHPFGKRSIFSLSLPETIHCHSFSIGICESAFLNLY